MAELPVKRESAVLQAVSRPWLKSYPPGVPTEIDTHQYGSLVELFVKSIRSFGPHLQISIDDVFFRRVFFATERRKRNTVDVHLAGRGHGEDCHFVGGFRPIVSSGIDRVDCMSTSTNARGAARLLSIQRFLAHAREQLSFEVGFLLWDGSTVPAAVTISAS